MKFARVLATIALASLFFSSSAFAAIQLIPVVTAGLTSPVFVGNARDGSNRLFIEEQSGLIHVLQPGSSTPTVFLDIHARVRFGGERGLLGLAFHPLYSNNRRFFVFYTREPDGAIVLAEYRVSLLDRNVADPTETVLLTIPHPNFGNHNGGMLAFGPDGYLYAGIGDGGSGNDPPNNAQNVNSLLGKILRIDVNPPAGSGLPYVSPSTNPFYGAIPGRDEIFAFGMRNPWRFSFDRITGQQWVADVGQGEREEIDTPIVNGGNYGWRVYEGSNCTGNDPNLCNPGNYILPVFDYFHFGGRCSITGGYVYRGTAGSLPLGSYVYGDYCSGEIFLWDGTNSTLLDTALNISSFGEDERGELYVVYMGGGISRIAGATGACVFSFNPTGQNFGPAGGSGSVAVTTSAGCSGTIVASAPWIHVTTAVTGFENAVVAAYSLAYTVDANPFIAGRAGGISIGDQTFTIQQGAQAGTRTPPARRTVIGRGRMPR